MPSKLWERIKLSENYVTALKQIDDRLIYWPNFLIHKCKQRLTRLVQVAIQSRRLAAEDKRLGEKLVGMPNKVRRRERTRERKALAAAKLERSIEKELIERLRSGAYGDKPLNVDENIWKKVLKGLERQGMAEGDVDDDELEEDEEEEGEGEEEEDEEEEEEDEGGEIEYVSGDEELEEEMADLEDWLGGSGASDFEGDSENDETDSEEDSEDESGEEGTPKTGAKVVGKKGKVDDSKKRKRGKAVQQPRKRKFQFSPLKGFLPMADTSFWEQVGQESKSSTRWSWTSNQIQLRIWRFRCISYRHIQGWLYGSHCNHNIVYISCCSFSLSFFCVVSLIFRWDLANEKVWVDYIDE